MRGKLTFVIGAAVGFVLGTRAGRERYDDIVRTTRKVLDNPNVHEAAGAVQAQATKLYTRGKDTLASSGITDRIAGRLRGPMAGRTEDDSDPLMDDTHQKMSSNSF
jgi:hypothetical protein